MTEKTHHTYLATAFRDACMAEITALKPGNVHIFADGHGMVVQDFIKSAEAATPAVSKSEQTVGQRILAAVEATRVAVGCNTNLGIVLLAAPLLKAAEEVCPNLHEALNKVLAELTVEDAIHTYQAIQLASPGGLGSSNQYDVNSVPEITLLAAMQAAQEWDLIAKQYANGYEQIFEFSLPAYQQILSLWDRPAWVVTALYLKLLAEFPDTHIVRKFDLAIAEQVRLEAQQHLDNILQLSNPKFYQKELLEFDLSLKSRGLNPGTTADMTVATLLAFNLSNIHH